MITLVSTNIETGQQTQRKIERWGLESKVAGFLASCPPSCVRQVYVGTREIARRERMTPEIIDIESTEVLVWRN